MEHKSYFHRVAAQTPTQFWVNNPTREEADLALAAGALGCTTNPSYCQKMIDHPVDGPYASALLDEAVRESRTDSEAQAILQRKLVRGIAEKFRPLYERTRGKHGYVSIQGDPIHEHDPQQILEEGLTNRELGENVCIKVQRRLQLRRQVIAAEVVGEGHAIAPPRRELLAPLRDEFVFVLPGLLSHGF